MTAFMLRQACANNGCWVACSVCWVTGSALEASSTLQNTVLLANKERTDGFENACMHTAIAMCNMLLFEQSGAKVQSTSLTPQGNLFYSRRQL